MTTFKLKTLKVRGEEFVILPRDDFDRLAAGFVGPDLTEDEDGHVDAIAFMRATIGRDLKAMREAAGFSRAELGARVGETQAIVSMAERGAVSVNKRYIEAVEHAVGPDAVARVEAAKKLADVPRDATEDVEVELSESELKGALRSAAKAGMSLEAWIRAVALSALKRDEAERKTRAKKRGKAA